jgi:hypothetical protein
MAKKTNQGQVLGTESLDPATSLPSEKKTYSASDFEKIIQEDDSGPGIRKDFLELEGKAEDFASYQEYLGDFATPEAGEDVLRRQRAQAQTGWEQGRRTLGTLPFDIALGIVENAGYLLDVQAHVNTLRGVGDDYSNFLTDLAKRGKEALDDNFAVYRENPNQVFDLSDPAWWWENGGGLVESIGEFLVTGAGVGKGLGALAKGVATTFNTAGRTTRGLAAAAQGATAMELAYTEGAMSGAEVYKETLEKALSQGKAEDEAKMIASAAAGKTVALNTGINTLLNFSSVNAAFRTYNASKDLAKKGLARLQGESRLDYVKRLMTNKEFEPIRGEMAKTLGFEAAQESAEEIVNRIAEEEGKYQGKKSLSLLTEDEEGLGFIERALKTIGTEETALAAILGAFGGIGQTAGMEYIPTRQRVKGEDGKVTTEWSSAASRKREAEEKAYNKQVDFLIKRVGAINDAHKKMTEATEKTQYEQAIKDLESVIDVSNIINGTEQQIISALEEVERMTLEEAGDAGYLEQFKEKARERIDEIKHFSDKWYEFQDKYTFNDDERLSGIAEVAFATYVDRYKMNKTIEGQESELADKKIKFERDIENAYGKSMNPEKALGLRDAQEIYAKSEALREAANIKRKEYDEAGQAKTRAQKEKLARQYGRPGKGKSIVKHAQDKIQAEIEKLDSRANKESAKLEKFWTKAEKSKGEPLTEQEFIQILAETEFARKEISNYEGVIEANRSTLRDFNESLSNLDSAKGRRDVVKAWKEAEEKFKEEAEARQKEESSKAEEETAAEASSKRKTRKRKKQEAKAEQTPETEPAPETTAEEAPVEETPVEEQPEAAPEQGAKGAPQTSKEYLEALKKTFEDDESGEGTEFSPSASSEGKMAKAQQRMNIVWGMLEALENEGVISDMFSPDGFERAFDWFDVQVDGLSNENDLKRTFLGAYEFAAKENGATELAKIIANKDISGLTKQEAQAADVYDSTPKPKANGDVENSRDDQEEADKDLTEQQSPDGNTIYAGDKIVLGSQALAYLSKGYKLVTSVDESTNTVYVKKSTNTNEKDAGLVEELESHDLFQVGEELYIAVDKEYTEKDEEGNEVNLFDKYTDAQGKIMDYSMIPMAVYSKDGVRIGNIHTEAWIRAGRYDRNPDGTWNEKPNSDFKNIANEGEMKGNGERQVESIVNIRKKLSEIFNDNMDAKVKTQITSVSVGKPQINIGENGKPEYSDTKEVVKQHEGLLITKNNTFYKNEDEQENDLVNTEKERPDGRLYYKVKTPVNGVFMALPLRMKTLGSNPEALNTVMEIIKAYVTNDEEVLDAIQEEIGIKISDQDSLREVLGLFGYTRDQSVSELRNEMEEPGVGKKPYLNVGKKREGRVVEIALHGRSVHTISDLDSFNELKENGLLEEILSELFFTAKLSDIRKAGEYRIPKVITNEDDTFEVSSISYDSHEDFVMTNSESIFRQNLIESTGEWNSFDQPIFLLDTGFDETMSESEKKNKREINDKTAELIEQVAADIYGGVPFSEFTEEENEIRKNYPEEIDIAIRRIAQDESDAIEAQAMEENKPLIVEFDEEGTISAKYIGYKEAGVEYGYTSEEDGTEEQDVIETKEGHYFLFTNAPFTSELHEDELREKLLEQEIPEEVIEKAIEDLKPSKPSTGEEPNLIDENGIHEDEDELFSPSVEENYSLSAEEKESIAGDVSDMLVTYTDKNGKRQVFGSEKQRQAVKSIAHAIEKRLSKKKGVNETLSEVKRLFEISQNNNKEMSRPEVKLSQKHINRIPGAKNLSQKEAKEIAAAIAEEMGIVLNNWEQFQTFAMEELANRGLTVTGGKVNFSEDSQDNVEVSEDTQDSVSESESSLEKTSYEDGANFTINHKDSASYRVKSLLSNIVDVEEIADEREIDAEIPQERQSGTLLGGSTQVASEEVKKKMGKEKPMSIDMVDAGLRTRVTVSAAKVKEMEDHKGSPLAVGDIITQYGKSENGETKRIKVRVTAIHNQDSDGWKGTWAKEGWNKHGMAQIDAMPNGSVAIEFEKVQELRPIKPKLNYLGLQSFMQYDTAYDDLQMILADVEPSFKEMMAVLNQVSSTKPWVRVLITKLNNSNQQTRNDFVKAMSKSYTEFKIVLFSKRLSDDKKSAAYSINTISANRNNVIQRIFDNWQENMKQSKLVRNDKGDVVIDSAQAKKIQSQLNTIYEKYTSKGKNPPDSKVLKMLWDMGISMPEEALSYFKINSQRMTGLNYRDHFSPKRKSDGIFNNIVASLVRKEEEGDSEKKFDINNPFSKEKSGIKTFAKITAKFTPSIYSSSHKNSEGKNIYSYVLNNYLTHKFRDLSQVKSPLRKLLGELSFSNMNNSMWIESLETNPKFREVFGISFMSGIQKRMSKQKGVERRRMSERELEFTMLSMFQNSNQGQGFRKISHFVYPTISDKTTSPVITALKHYIKREGLSLNEDNTFSLPEETLNELYKIAKSEINRIHNFQKEKTRKAIKDKQYSQYEDGAELVYMFPFLNRDQLADQESVLWEKDGTIKASSHDQAAIKELIQGYVETLVSETIDNWGKIGIVKENEIMMDSRYLQNIPGENVQQKILYAALDVEINYLIANANMYQMFIGDPATHYKKSKKKNATSRDHVESTMVEVQKRLAKDIAPGMDADWQGKNTYKVIYAQDKKVASQIEEYKGKFGNAYVNEKAEATDAQELTTLQEHIDVMFAYGKLDESIYDSISKKISSAVADEKNPDNYYELSEEEKSAVLQPMKPVYVNNDISKEMDVNRMVYVKSSSFPLIPEMTRELDIDKLRVQMESRKDDKGNPDPIQRLAHITSTKLGVVNPVSVYNKDGSVIEDIDMSKPDKLFRRGLRIQQEVPHDPTKTQILTVSQMNKLLFEGIENLSGFDYKGGKDPKGNPWTGETLRDEKERIRIEMMDIKKSKLFKKLEIRELPNGEIVFDNLKKIKKALVEEAKSRGGYSINAIKSLELTEDKKSFRIPLGFNNSVKSFEPLLLSMITKNVLQQKVNGKSWVQGTSAGMMTKRTKATPTALNSLSAEQRSKMVFVEGFENEKGLKYLRTSKDKSKLEPIQIMVPFIYKDNNGNPLKVEDFMKEVDGKRIIDKDKLPDELRRLIGARIPNQGHNSMAPIEIVGFLPPQMGDLIIVPEEIVVQMGSDFDVDKLYTYIYNYKQKKDGSLVKITDEKTYRGVPVVDSDNIVNAEGKKGAAKYKDDTILVDRELLKQKFEEKAWTNPRQLFEEIHGEKIGSMAEALPEDAFSTYKEFEDFVIEHEYQHSIYTRAQFDSENPGKTKGDYETEINSRALKSMGEASLDGNKKSIRSLGNDYMDIHWAVLTHPEMLDRILFPLDMGELKDLTAEVGGMRAKPKKGILSRRQQIEDFISNREGKSLVGITSLGSTFNSIIQNQNLYARRVVNNEEERIYFDIEVDGKKVSLGQISGIGKTSRNGVVKTKAQVISFLQSAAVDNAKEQVLDKLNLNVNTVNAAMALAMMEDSKGVSVDEVTIGLFTAQDILIEVSNEMYITSDSLEENFTADRKQEAINKILEKYTEEYEAIKGPGSADTLKSRIIEKEIEPLSEKRLREAIKDGAEGNLGTDYYETQIQALMMFQDLNDIGTQISELQAAMNADSRGVGKDMVETIYKKEQIIGADHKTMIANTDAIFGTFEDKVLFPTTEVGNIAYNGPMLASRMFNKLFHYEYTQMDETFKYIETHSMKSKRGIDRDFKREIIDAVKSYVYANESFLGEDPTDLRKRLMFDYEENKSLATRISEAKSSWGAKNFFLQRISTQFATEEDQPSLIKYSSSTAERSDDQESIKALVDMLISNDPTQESLAEDMIKYAYATGGLQDAISIIKFIPTSYLYAKGFDTKLQQVAASMRNSSVDKNFIKEFYQHFPHRAVKTTETLEEAQEKQKIDDKIVSFTFPNAKGSPLTNMVIQRTNEDGIVEYIYPDFITRRNVEQKEWELFENKGIQKDGTNLFVKIDTKGTFGMREFNSTNSKGSIISEKQSELPIEVKKSEIKNTPVSKEVENPNPNRNVYDKYNIPEVGQEGSLELSLSSIENESGSKYRSFLASILSKNLENIVPVSFESVKSDLSFKAAYRQGEMKINRSQIDKAKDLVKALEESIIHETFHAFTADFARIYELALEGNKDAKKIFDSYPPKIKRALKSLEAVRKKAESQLTEKEKENLEDLKDRIKRLGEGDKSVTFSQSELNDLYGLTNLREFISMTMESKSFQKRLNSIEFKEDKSLFERIKDILYDIFKALSEEIGIDIKDDSALKASISNIIDMVSEESVSPTVIEDSKVYEYHGGLYRFIYDEQGNVINYQYAQKPDGEQGLKEHEGSKKKAYTMYSKIVEYGEGTIWKGEDATDIEEQFKAPEDKSTLRPTFSYNGITINTEFPLGEEQEKALKHMIDFAMSSDRDRIAMTLEGYAGTGKTSVIALVQEYLKKAMPGSGFAYIAPTHSATVSLGLNVVKYGVYDLPATFASAVRYDKKKDKYVLTKKIKDRLTGKVPFLVIDEASMFTDKDAQRMLEAAKHDRAKIIFVGDSKQIPAVIKNVSEKSISPAFSDFEKSTLNKVHRTKDNSTLNVLNNIRSNARYVEYKTKENSDSIKFLSLKDYNSELYNDLKNNPEDVLIISYSNSSVQKINAQAREMLGHEGEPKEGEKIIGYLGSGAKQIERKHLANAISYKISRTQKLDNGQVLVVAKSKLLKSVIDKGMKIPSDSTTFTYMQLSKTDSFDFNLNEEQMKNNNETLSSMYRIIHQLNSDYEKGLIYYQAYVEAVYAMQLELSDYNTGSVYIYNPKTDRMEKFVEQIHKGIKSNLKMDKGVDFGYGLTIHKSQGMTIPKVYFNPGSLAGDNINITLKKESINTEKNALYYVAMSRSSEKLVVLDSGTAQIVEDAGEDFSFSPSPDYGQNKDFHYPKNWSSSMRTIANKHFRKEMRNGKKTTPRYPLFIRDYKEAMKKIREINSSYGVEVVKWGRDYDVRTGNPKEGIVFTRDFKTKPDFSTGDQLTLFSPSAESKKDEFEQLIDMRERRIKNIQRSLYKKGVSEAKRDELKERIRAIELDIERLDSARNVAAIQEVASSSLSWAEKMMEKKSLTSGEIQQVFEEINMWSKINDVIVDPREATDKENSYNIAAKEISSRADMAFIALQDIATKHVVEQVKANSKQEIDEAEIRAMVEAGIAETVMLDLGRIDNKLTQFIDSKLKDAARLSNLEFTEMSKELEGIMERLKKSSLFKKNGFEIMLQKDKDGEWTGGLVTRYSQEYWDTHISYAEKRKKVINNPKASKEKKAKANKEYFDWLKENTFYVDSRELFTLNDDGEVEIGSDEAFEKERQRIMEQLEVSEKRADEMIDDAQNKFESYVERFIEFKEEVESMVVDGEIDSTEAAIKMTDWKIENSPESFLKNVIDGVKDVTTGRTFNREGYKYIVDKPALFNSEGNRTNWYDKDFARISEDKAMLEFYNFFRDKMSEYMKNLPYFMVSDLQRNFIPEIAKGLLEDYSSNGLRGAAMGLKEGFIDSISMDKDAIAARMERDIDGNPEKSIPVRFVTDRITKARKAVKVAELTYESNKTAENKKRLEEARKKLDILKDSKSKNLAAVLEQFALMSLNYKHKSKVEDSVLLANRILGEAIENELNSKGERATDTEGKIIEKKNGLVKLKQAAQYAIDAHLYGEKALRPISETKIPVRFMKNGKRLKEIENEIKELDKKVASGKITEEEHDDLTKKLEKEYKELGGNRNLVWSKVFDHAIQFTQLKGMSYNLFSASANILFGLMGNMIHANGRVDFDNRQALRAMRVMLKHSKGFGPIKKKVEALMERYDVLFEVNEAAYDKARSRKNKLKKLGPYEFQKRTEFFIQGMTMVATMMNTTITDKDGNTSNLFDAYDSDGKLKESFKTDENSKEWEGNIDDDADLKSYKSLRDKVIQLNKRIHGNYDPNSPVMIKKWVLGRMATQFRSWVAEGFASRVEGEKFDEQLGRKVKGRYVTMWELASNGSLPKVMFNQILGKKNAFEGMSEVDIENMRKNLAEMVFGVALGSMLLLLNAGLEDEDDSEKAKAMRILMNLIIRAESDVYFYVDPGTFVEITQSPLPVMRTVIDFQRAMDGIYKYATDEDYDAERMWSKITRAFPILNQYNRFKYQSEKLLPN